MSIFASLLGKVFTAANAPALITGGASVLGGIIDRNERRKDAYANSPQGIREAAEAAGFNPLSVLGLAGNFGAGYAPTMGAKIANGIAAAMDQNQYADQLGIQKARLEMENRELNAQLEQMKLNPTVRPMYETIPDEFGVDPIPEVRVSELINPDKQFAEQALAQVQGLPTPDIRLTQNSKGEIVSDTVESASTTYVTPQGRTYMVPKGLDVDEMMSGFFMHNYGKLLDLKGGQSWKEFMLPEVRRLTDAERENRPSFSFKLGPTNDPWVTFPNY